VFIVSDPVKKKYEKNAVEQLRGQCGAGFSDPVHVRALFYREKNLGDLTNFEQMLGDILQAAGVVANDSLIESWDGSRKLKDVNNPRTEVEIVPYVEE
jgi:hypothetical protein